MYATTTSQFLSVNQLSLTSPRKVCSTFSLYSDANKVYVAPAFTDDLVTHCSGQHPVTKDSVTELGTAEGRLLTAP